MLTNLAALGIGLVTAVATPATAQASCAPTQRSSTTIPGYGHAPVPPYPARPSFPEPRVQAPARVDAISPAALRYADHNRDGGVSYDEARGYARAQFSHADHDRNGVLQGRELRQTQDPFVQASRGRDGVVTFAEYDASVMGRFYSLDLDRNGYVTRYELDNNRTRTPLPPRANPVTISWHWQL